MDTNCIEKIQEILSGKTIEEKQEILRECLNELMANVIDVPFDNEIYSY